jgi:hypothetical protein
VKWNKGDTGRLITLTALTLEPIDCATSQQDGEMDHHKMLSEKALSHPDHRDNTWMILIGFLIVGTAGEV